MADERRWTVSAPPVESIVFYSVPNTRESGLRSLGRPRSLSLSPLLLRSLLLLALHGKEERQVNLRITLMTQEASFPASKPAVTWPPQPCSISSGRSSWPLARKPYSRIICADESTRTRVLNTTHKANGRTGGRRRSDAGASASEGIRRWSGRTRKHFLVPCAHFFVLHPAQLLTRGYSHL